MVAGGVAALLLLAGSSALVEIVPAVSGGSSVAAAVSQPTVTMSSTSAGATHVTYAMGFTTGPTGAIPAGGTITLSAPAGTLFPGAASYSLVDTTTSTANFSSASSARFAEPGLPIYNFLNSSGSVVTIGVPNAINAGDSLTLTVVGVSNPGSGPGTLSVSTSADPVPVPSSAYTITPPASVSQPSVALSSASAGATQVTYTVGFTTSATGAIPPGGTITLSAPPGTLLAGSHFPGDYVLTDATTPTGSFASAASIAFADPGLPVYNFLDSSGSVVTIGVPNAIHAGDSVSLAVSGSSNPSAGTGSLSVSTSADPTSSSSAPFTITAPSSVTQPAVSLSSSASGATGVTYSIHFVTGSLLPAGSQITVAAPPGTAFAGSNCDYALADTNTPSAGFACANGVQSAGATVTVTLPNAVPAGDALTLTSTAVTNPGGGTRTLAVSTTSDPSPTASSTYVITGAATSLGAVSAATLSATTTAASAHGVTYSVGLTTSATGALVGGQGTITLFGPAGTIFGGCPYGCGGGNPTYTIIDATHSSGSGPASPVVDSGSLVSVMPSNSISAGDSITIIVTGVTNPPANAAPTLSLSTSADPAPVSIADPTAAEAPTTGVTLSSTSEAAGANGITYTVAFTASGQGQLLGGLSTVNLAAPAGTIFGSCPYGCGGGNPTITFTDATHPSGSGQAGSNSVTADGSVVSIVVPNTILAGDRVVMSVTQVTNPPTAGNGSLVISTSSDGPRSAVADPVLAASPVSFPSMFPGSTAAGATGVTYSLSFTTSANGAIEAGLGAITIQAPGGTNFGSLGAVKISDLTNPSAGGAVTPEAAVAGGSTVSLVPSTTIGGGDVVLLTVPGVTNPPTTGAQVLQVSTSSDPTATPVTFTLGTGVAVTGIVKSSAGAAAVGATVQACVPSGGCATATTDGSGTYQLDLVAGSYALTAFPPPGSGDGQGVATLTVGTSPQAGPTITLGTPPGLGTGVTVTPSGGTPEGSGTIGPRVNWAQPFQAQYARSMFPGTGTVIATQLVINGTDSTTGLPATHTVNLGGSVAGLPAGIVLGSGPLTVTVPSTAPIHGTITTAVNYVVYPNGSAPPPGIANTQVLDLQYPSAPPSEGITDPLPAYFTNDGSVTPVTIGSGSITGTDAQYFSLVPLASMGVPSGTTDCGGAPATLSQFDGTTSNPPPSTECGMGVQFTPPTNGTKIFYSATLNAPATAGTTSGSIPITLNGCDARVAAAAGQESCFQGTGGESQDDSGGTGGQGNGGGADDSTGGGSMWDDPSGTVAGTDGHGHTAPLAGATVSLQRASSPNGPFAAVPNGSAVMSPGNRVNPGTTGGDGGFAWDVIAGAYQVAASKAGCASATTPVINVPPPATGLGIVLTCPTLPARSATQTALTTSSATVPRGQPVTFTSTVTGPSSPSGSVTFSDGTSVIGTAVLTGGTATLTLATLPLGTHTVAASYAGDATNQPSASVPVNETVTGPTSGAQSITGVKPAYGPAAGGTLVTIKGAGFVGTTSVHFGSSAATSFSVNKRGTRITAPSPPGVGTVSITVTGPSGTSAPMPASAFRYAPAVTRVTPNSDRSKSTVTITGTNFSDATSVHVGTASAAFTIKSSKQLAVTVPAQPPGSVDVTVTSPGGTSQIVSADRFTYVAR